MLRHHSVSLTLYLLVELNEGYCITDLVLDRARHSFLFLVGEADETYSIAVLLRALKRLRIVLLVDALALVGNFEEGGHLLVISPDIVLLILLIFPLFLLPSLYLSRPHRLML